MIITPQDDRLLCITQVDHAHLAAEIAKLWRADGFPEHPRRDEILFAIREHDNGWQETDAAPAIDPSSGAPLDFLTIDETTRVEIWQRGSRRFRESEPWAALLIGRHASTLLGGGTISEPTQRLFDELREFETETLEQLDRTESELAADYLWLHRLDAISLAACGAWGGVLAREDIHGRAEGGELSLAPFPLAGTTTFRLPTRTVEARRFASDGDLARELALSRWERRSIRVCPTG